MLKVAIIATVIGAGLAGIVASRATPTSRQPVVQLPSVTDNIFLRDLNWTKGGFGVVMSINSVDIVNGNTFPIRDFEIRCLVKAPSGTVVNDLSHRVYQRIGAQQTETLNDLNVGFINAQGSYATCRVVDAKRGLSLPATS